MPAEQRPRTYSWLAHQPMQRKILLAIAVLLGLFLVSAGMNLSSVQRAKNTRDWSEHTYEVLLELNQVYVAALERQVGSRGYLLTQQPGELATFERGTSGLKRHLQRLRALTRDNPLQQGRLDRLDEMTSTWEKEARVNGFEAVRKVNASDPAQAALDRQNAQKDYFARRTVLTSDVLALLTTMADTERDLLAARNDALDRTLDIDTWVNIGSMLACLLFGMGVVAMTFRLITRPIRRMTDLMTRLAAHDHAIEIRQVERRDEIGEIARALGVFRQMAIDTASQTWVKANVSNVSRQLQGATTFREFADTLTSALVPLLKAGVGVFYGRPEGEERLALLGSYGFRGQGQPTASYGFGEGLVGQVARENAAIHLDDVPDGYARIHSATGEANPRSVAVWPVASRGHVLGVLEIASFAPFSPVHEAFLAELLPIVALSLENLSRAIATQELLHRTQEQAERLRLSEETLRQQQQELTDSNGQLQARTLELQEQSQRLLASEEELRVQTEELQASNEELRQQGETLAQQKTVLQLLQQETQEKAEELARASQYKSDFLANMSHELRTPLNSLLILSRSLADNEEGNLDGEQVESARIIHDSGSNLLRLINDILDLSKVEAGKMELVIDAMALADFERSLRRTFGHVAQEKKLGFSVTVEPGMPERIATDSGKLEQVANNLVSNAFKFTASGSVDVHIGRPPAGIALPPALEGKPAVAVSVRDSGIGIPPEKFDRVFNAFEQVDASTSRQYGGTGLGLAISRRMAELLGGDILLQSMVGEGSTFTIVLPERAPEATAGETAGPGRPGHAPAGGSHGGYNPATTTQRHPAALLPESIEDDRHVLGQGDTVILVVEDDPSFARILADMIRRKGHRVLAAADGESGLALARQFTPTGILLDVMLPGMDGWTVIERLKAEATTRHIPVHFISATDDANRGRELGAVGFLTKPVSRESIAGAFERLLHFAEGSTRHLLIVDDDADSRAAIRTLLRGDGVTIDEAGSAEEALERSAATRYDCIVLDLGLPGMSGMDFLEHASRRDAVPPVVVYSGRDLSREESLRIRQYTDSIVIKGARSPERLLDEVSLFLHSIQQPSRTPAPTAATAAPAQVHGDGDFTGRKLLLVDDDMRNLFALSKVLRARGLVVLMAQDGAKALRTLDEDKQVELVLMDIMMPVMDGYDTMKAIRARPGLERLPIIALTAKAMRGDREKCLEAGANDYLSKPIDVDKLLQMIRVWLPER